MGAQVVVNALGQLLKSGAGGAATARAGGDAGHKRAQAQGLQNFSSHHHFLRARLAGLGCERDADGLANAFLQQDGQRCRRGHRALGAHARFGQAQVQGVVAAARQFAVHRNQVLHAADFARQQNVLALQAQLLGALGGGDGGGDERLVHHLARVPGRGALGVGVHQLRQQLLVKAAPVHANAHGLVVARSDLNHLRELAVFFLALADVARVDAVLGERLGTGGKVTQQAVAVVVKVAHQGHGDAHAVKLLTDVGHGLCGLGGVDGDAYQL